MKEIGFRRLDKAVASDYMEDILLRAENGDVHAAKDALMTIAGCLSSQNLNPTTGESLPVPPILRDYLSKAFYRMCGGTPPAIALNLSRPGRKNRRHLEKKLAAYLVYQGVHEKGQTILQAVWDAAAHINKKSEKNELTGNWSGFNGKKLEPENLQDWYYEFKNDLESIYATYLPPS